MPCDVRFLDHEGIVLTEYLPPYGTADFLPCITATLEVAAQHGSLLFLGDCRALPPEGSVFDVYELGSILDGMGLDHRMREALVVNVDADALDTFDFFVTVTSNRGLKVGLFETVEEATTWLLDEAALQAEPLDTHPPDPSTLHDTTE